MSAWFLSGETGVYEHTPLNTSRAELPASCQLFWQHATSFEAPGQQQGVRTKPLPVNLFICTMRVPAVTHSHVGREGSHNNLYIVLSTSEDWPSPCWEPILDCRYSIDTWYLGLQWAL